MLLSELPNRMTGIATCRQSRMRRRYENRHPRRQRADRLRACSIFSRAGPQRNRAEPRSQTCSMAGSAVDARTPGPWISALENSEVCINLTGRSVNCRYHAENRRAMYDSRIVSTQLLGQKIHRISGSMRAPRPFIGTRSTVRWMRQQENSVATNLARPRPGISPSKLQKTGRRLSSQRKHRVPARSPYAVP